MMTAGALVAEDSLRSYDQVNDRMYSEGLEIKSVMLVPGSSGLKLVTKPETMLEGFRPRRILRLLAENWPLSELPWEETHRSPTGNHPQIQVVVSGKF